MGMKEHFAEITDTRRGYLVTHKLTDVVVVAVCATICGADTWKEIGDWAKNKKKWLREKFGMEEVPSSGTIRRVFIVIDPEEFQEAFQKWVGSVIQVTKGQVIAIDGKQMRGSREKRKGAKALCIVSAWATANQMVLGQRKTEEKSNEITAIPELLKLLDVSGCIVTIDAAGCQVNNAELVREKDGDYLFSLKGNQGTMLEDVKLVFECAERQEFSGIDADSTETYSQGHGRTEVRRCWAIDDDVQLELLRNRDKWRDLQTIVKIETERTVLGKPTSTEVQYYITSLVCDAVKILDVKRSHWGVENQLHWSLDVAFGEDKHRCGGNQAANLAVVRHMAHGLLKQEPTRRSLNRKRKLAGWDTDYLEKILEPN